MTDEEFKERLQQILDEHAAKPHQVIHGEILVDDNHKLTGYIRHLPITTNGMAVEADLVMHAVIMLLIQDGVEVYLLPSQSFLVAHKSQSGERHYYTPEFVFDVWNSQSGNLSIFRCLSNFGLQGSKIVYQKSIGRGRWKEARRLVTEDVVLRR